MSAGTTTSQRNPPLQFPPHRRGTTTTGCHSPNATIFPTERCRCATQHDRKTQHRCSPVFEPKRCAGSPKAADRLQYGQGCLIGPSRPHPEDSTRYTGAYLQSIGAGLGCRSALALHPRCDIDRLSAGKSNPDKTPCPTKRPQSHASPEIIRNLLPITNYKSLLF